MFDDERGVSDVIAFVLTFSIIILSIASVSIVGVDNLTEFRDREQVNNAERGMVALAATLDDLHRQGEQLRATELSLAGGTVETSNNSTLWMRVERASGADQSWSYQLGSIQHRLDMSFGETVLSYEAGAVFSSSNANPLYEPAIRCTSNPSDTAIVSVVNLTGTFSETSSRSSQFSIRTDTVPGQSLSGSDGDSIRIFGDLDRNANNSGLVYSETNISGTVYLNVSGMRNSDVWNRHLGSSWVAVSGSDNVWRCSAENAVIRVSTIDVSQP